MCVHQGEIGHVWIIVSDGDGVVVAFRIEVVVGHVFWGRGKGKGKGGVFEMMVVVIRWL